jgi:hypothetical protein
MHQYFRDTLVTTVVDDSLGNELAVLMESRKMVLNWYPIPDPFLQN